MRQLTNQELRKKFGTFIYEGRVKKKLYQREVAKEIGITQANYSQIERGVREPNLTTIMDICKVLDLDFSEFLETVTKRRKVPQRYQTSDEEENLTMF